MSSMRFLPTSTGFVGTRTPIIEFSPPANEKIDYSGDNWDLGDEPAPLDTNKFSHLTIEEGEITFPPETILPHAETVAIECKLFASLFSPFIHHTDIVLMSF